MLDDHDQISQVLIRYATGIDQKDWPLLRTCWTDDVVVDYDTLGQYTGADTLTEVMKQTHQNMGPTYHRVSNFVIDVDGGRAAVRSYVHAVLLITPGDPSNWLDAVGHYDDEFVRHPAGWRISRRVSRVARLLTGGDLAKSLVSGVGVTA